MKVLHTFYLLILLCIVSNNIFSQHNRYTLNFSQKEYGDSCTAQNWSVVQDNRGIMYFGNASRVLEYDGINWNGIRTPLFGGYVTSMAADDNGNIFVGANGEFGYLKPNLKGELKYRSLSENLSEDDAFFGNIWRTMLYKDEVVFFSQESIFITDKDSIKVIYPETSFHLAFVVNNKLYARQRETGLMEYREGKFELIPDGEKFKEYGVFGFFPINNTNKYLIVTQEIGLFTYDLIEKSINPLNTQNTELLNNSQIIGGTLLHDNNIALNTVLNGVIVIDVYGNIITKINQNTGVNDNHIKQVFQDNENNLWLAINSGISKVSYSSPISFYKNEEGIFGRVQSVIKHANKIYVGTSEGLYIQNTNTNTRTYKHFVKNKEFIGDVLSLTSIGDILLIGSAKGIYQIVNDRISVINRSDASAVYWSEQKKQLYIAGQNGFIIYSYNGIWRQVLNMPDLVINNPLTISEDLTNSKEQNLWIGTLNNGVYNVKIGNDLSVRYNNYYGAKFGLDEGWIKPFKYEKSIKFGLFSGLLEFNQKDSLFGPSVSFMNITESFTNIFDTENIAWLCLDDKIAYYDKAIEKIVKDPFKSIELGNINDLYIESDSKLWIAADEGLSMFDLSWNRNESSNISVLIRNVIADSLLFAGTFPGASEQPDYLIPVLKYNQNTISFKFASLTNENGFKAEYSYMLDNFDDDWSIWSLKCETNYKRLPEGKYVFKVKAKDIYGNESDLSTYKFTILPPWYRTAWAYAMYVVLLILLVYGIVRLSILRLKAKNEQLERIVEERTAEIRKQKEEIEHQKEEIEDSINYAKRIQHAVLPRDNFAEEVLNEHFILFKPKDVVSGDFYWVAKVDKYVIATAADCTGHGVPGAFMSMLGVSFLNEIVNNNKITQASLILDKLRGKIIEALQQKGENEDQKDGMDMALCIIDTETNKLQFAGANNPLYIVSKNFRDSGNEELIKVHESESINLHEVKADKMPIAIYVKLEGFRNYEVQLKEGDCVYMFSDGYADQFGGPKGKKFMYKPFKEMLVSNYNKPMNEQKEILDQKIEEWKSYIDPLTEKPFEQIDDIVVMGIRI